MLKKIACVVAATLVAFGTASAPTDAMTVQPAYSQYGVHHVCGSAESVPWGYRHWYRNHWQGYWFVICGGQYPAPKYGRWTDAGWAWWGGGQTPIRTRSRLFVETFCPGGNASDAYSQIDWYESNARKQYGKHLFHKDTYGYRHFWSFSVPIYSSFGLWRKIHMVKQSLGTNCYGHHSFIYVTLLQDPPKSTSKFKSAMTKLRSFLRK